MHLLDLIIIAVIVMVSIVLVYLKFFRRFKYHEDIVDDREAFRIQYLTEQIRDMFDDVLKTDYTALNLNREELEKNARMKETLRSSLKKCTHGNLGAKLFVVDYIKDALQRKLRVTAETIDKCIPFDHVEELSSEYKFMSLLHIYKKKFDVDAMSEFVSRNGLDRPIGEGTETYYEITSADIDLAFRRHRQIYDNFTFADKLAILAQKVYQSYKGLGVIDDIRFMKIDGINCGTSGIPRSFYSYGADASYGAKPGELARASFNAVWLMYHGKKIHLSFIGFESEAELIRVVKNACRYNNAPTLSRTKGYIVNTSEDGCRIVGTRPEMAESWALFIRKFDVASKMTLRQLYPFKGIEKLESLLFYIIGGCCNSGLTGQQATGKSTALMALIGAIPKSFSIRVQEMAFELYLRKIYPERNILTFQDTPTVSAQQGIELQKKSDGDVNLFGEVAQAAVVPLAIKLGQTGSAMLLFTSHHKTTDDLVKEWADDLVSEGASTDSKKAEETVAQVLCFDIHLARSIEGVRYIERITEIMPHIAEAYSTDVQEATLQFFYRMTDRRVFDTKDIIIYDNGVYRFVNDISFDKVRDIRRHFSQEQQVALDTFLDAMHKEVIENRRNGFVGYSSQDLAQGIYTGMCVDENNNVIADNREAIAADSANVENLNADQAVQTMDIQGLQKADYLFDQTEFLTLADSVNVQKANGGDNFV